MAKKMKRANGLYAFTILVINSCLMISIIIYLLVKIIKLFYFQFHFGAEINDTYNHECRKAIRGSHSVI